MKEIEEEPVKGQAEVGNNSSGDENQMLISKKKVKSDSMPVCYRMRRCCGCIISRERRSLTLKGRRSPGSFPTNKQNNRKYNACTLIPMVLFNQFKFFYNFFFLVIALTQFIPVLKVGKFLDIFFLFYHIFYRLHVHLRFPTGIRPLHLYHEGNFRRHSKNEKRQRYQ